MNQIHYIKAEKLPNGNDLVKKSLTSFDGTKTEFYYEDDYKGNIYIGYNTELSGDGFKGSIISDSNNTTTDDTNNETPTEDNSDDGNQTNNNDDAGGDDDFNIDTSLDGTDDNSSDDSSSSDSSITYSSDNNDEAGVNDANTDIYSSLTAEEQAQKIMELKKLRNHQFTKAARNI